MMVSNKERFRLAREEVIRDIRSLDENPTDKGWDKIFEIARILRVR
jgi:hypothetical protein